MASGRTIFIVEDELILALDLKETLERHGFEVIGHSVTGEEAITQILKRPPDVILMDIKLAGRITGIEAAREIRKSINAVLIYCTAYSNSEMLSEAEDTCPFAFITKPFTETSLIGVLGEALTAGAVPLHP